jgi:hypothetical protein
MSDVRNCIVLRTDRKGIAENDKILPIQDATLRFREIFETEKTRSLLDGFLINGGSSALDSCRIMMEPHRKAIATEFLYPYASESLISQTKIAP